MPVRQVAEIDASSVALVGWGSPASGGDLGGKVITADAHRCQRDRATADLDTKWAPRYVRVADDLPATATTKVLKRVLGNEGWDRADPVWWRPEKGSPLPAAEPDGQPMMVPASVKVR